MGGVQHSTILLAKSLNKIESVDIKILIPKIGKMSSECDKFSITYDFYNRLDFFSTSISLFNDKIRIINPFSYIYNLFVIIINAFSLKNILSRNNVDIVLSKGLGSHFSCSLACKMMGKKVIWHLQDLISDRYFGFLHFIINHTANLFADFVICDGQLIKENLRGYAYNNSKVIFNGVNVDELKISDVSREATRNELKIPLDAYVIGNVARITSWKGQKYLLNAFIEYSKVNKKAFLLLVGSPLFDGQKYYKELQDIIKKNNLIKRVILPGYRLDLQNIFSSIDLFAYTSVEKDTTPLSLISALSSGLPIIVSNIPSLSEVISCFENVKTFECNDSKNIILLLKEYEDKETRELHGAINRRCAKKYFDISIHTEQMLDVFLNLDNQLK